MEIKIDLDQVTTDLKKAIEHALRELKDAEIQIKNMTERINELKAFLEVNE